MSTDPATLEQQKKIARLSSEIYELRFSQCIQDGMANVFYELSARVLRDEGLSPHVDSARAMSNYHIDASNRIERLVRHLEGQIAALKAPAQPSSDHPQQEHPVRMPPVTEVAHQRFAEAPGELGARLSYIERQLVDTNARLKDVEKRLRAASDGLVRPS